MRSQPQRFSAEKFSDGSMRGVSRDARVVKWEVAEDFESSGLTVDGEKQILRCAEDDLGAMGRRVSLAKSMSLTRLKPGFRMTLSVGLRS